MSSTATRIEVLLDALSPLEILLTDDSAHHAGHAGAAGGGGHYHLRIVSSRFDGLGRIARHRLVYATLDELMGSAIHALAIEALTPTECTPEASHLSRPHR